MPIAHADADSGPTQKIDVVLVVADSDSLLPLYAEPFGEICGSGRLGRACRRKLRVPSMIYARRPRHGCRARAERHAPALGQRLCLRLFAVCGEARCAVRSLVETFDALNSTPVALFIERPKP